MSIWWNVFISTCKLMIRRCWSYAELAWVSWWGTLCQHKSRVDGFTYKINTSFGNHLGMESTVYKNRGPCNNGFIIIRDNYSTSWLNSIAFEIGFPLKILLRTCGHRELGQNQCGLTECLLMLASPGWTGSCTIRNECIWTEAQRTPGMLCFYLESFVFLGCTSLLCLTAVLIIFWTQEEINKYADNDPATYESMSKSSAPLHHYPDLHQRSHLQVVANLWDHDCKWDQYDQIEGILLRSLSEIFNLESNWT